MRNVTFLLPALKSLNQLPISKLFHIIQVWGPTTIMWISITQWFVPILAILPTHAWPEFDFYLVITSTAMRLTNDGVSTAVRAIVY